MMLFLVAMNTTIGAVLLAGGEPLRAIFSLLVALFIALLHWEEIGE